MKKRYLSLIAGFVATVLDAFFIVQEVKSIRSLISDAWKGSGSTIDTAFTVAIVFSAFLALYSIFANLRMALYFTYSHERYMSKLKRVYRAIFVNALAAGFIIFDMTKEYTLLSLFTAILSVVAAACITVDMVLEKKRVPAPAAEGKNADTAAVETSTADVAETSKAATTAETTAVTEEKLEVKDVETTSEEAAETEPAGTVAEEEKPSAIRKKKTSK